MAYLCLQQVGVPISCTFFFTRFFILTFFLLSSSPSLFLIFNFISQPKKIELIFFMVAISVTLFLESRIHGQTAKFLNGSVFIKKKEYLAVFGGAEPDFGIKISVFK